MTTSCGRVMSTSSRRTKFCYTTNGRLWHAASLPICGCRPVIFLILPICSRSVMRRVSEHLPAFISSYILMQPPEEEITGTMTEHSIVHQPRSHSRIVHDIVEQIKPVVVPEIEPEPPASFMRIPKLKRWECQKYLQWVKSQPCCVCGQQADDPHHIIGHGTGGTGTKTHDILPSHCAVFTTTNYTGSGSMGSKARQPAGVVI